MADIKNFSLVGVGPKVQFGKAGSKLVQEENGVLSFKTANEQNRANVEVAVPTTSFHATTKQYVDSAVDGLQTELDNLSSSRIVDSKTATTAMVATDEATGKVTIDAKGVAGNATRVATFESGTAADTSMTISNAVAGEVKLQATSSEDNANLHLQPKGDGHVVIGESGTSSMMAADDESNLTLAGGFSAAGVGGDLILRGGAGATGSGDVMIQTGNEQTHTRFITNAGATAGANITVGTGSVAFGVVGPETDVNVVLAPQGAGVVAVNGAKIQNLAPGVAQTDAVTVGQLTTAGVENKVGSLQTREITISTATMNIGAPIRGHIRRVMLKVTTPYSEGAQLTVGRSGFLDEIVDSNQIDETAAGVYDLNISHKYAVEVQLVATITGGPSSGAAVLVVEYIQG
jgi:hypothetical protein